MTERNAGKHAAELATDAGQVAGVAEPVAGALNPAAVEPAALARALGVPEATVRAHIERGAPVAMDGTINLVHYAAWLNQQLRQRHDGD